MRPSVEFRLQCAHLSNSDCICNGPISQIQIAFAMGLSIKLRLHLQWAHLSNSDCICNAPHLSNSDFYVPNMSNLGLKTQYKSYLYLLLIFIFCHHPNLNTIASPLFLLNACKHQQKDNLKQK